LFGAFATTVFEMAYQMISEQSFFEYMFFFLMGISIVFFGVGMAFLSINSKKLDSLIIAGALLFSIGGILWGFSLFSEYPLNSVLSVGTFVLLILIVAIFVIPSFFQEHEGSVDAKRENGLFFKYDEDFPKLHESEDQTIKIVRTIYIREKKEIERDLSSEKIAILLVLPIIVVCTWIIILNISLESIFILVPGFCIVGLPLGMRFIIRRNRLVKDYKTGNVEVIKGYISNATSYWPLLSSFRVGDYRFWIDGTYDFYILNGDRIEIVRGPLSKKLIKIKVPRKEIYMP
jgi:hypothetical protein